MSHRVTLTLLLLYFVFYVSVARGIEKENRYEVICPAFEENTFDNDPSASKFKTIRATAEDKYCQCSLTDHGKSKTAILKCEFNYEKDIVLTGTLFPFRTLNVTSAYVRMTNTKSALITSGFLSSWMDAPSSALDLWHCGEVIIDSTPTLHEYQLFSKHQTFVGVGLIDCNIDRLPPYFLRDRSRGAMRIKNCNVTKMSKGIFHNIEEVRYMNIEDSVVKEVEGPLSTDGVITLSKKEIHSWDGIEIINSVFEHVAAFSFNVTHKFVLEKFSVKKSHFGKLEEGAIKIVGDLNATFVDCSFSHLDPLAIQISVNGKLEFMNNVIENYTPDSLLGLNCSKITSAMNNNTFYVFRNDNSENSSVFIPQCGQPKVFYLTKPSRQEGRSHRVTTSSVVAISVLIILLCVVGLVFWGWRNKSLFRYNYRRSDTPLWKEEK